MGFKLSYRTKCNKVRLDDFSLLKIKHLQANRSFKSAVRTKDLQFFVESRPLELVLSI
jgi:hypothetical protein